MVMIKEATPDKTDSAPILLQGHMDMVAVHDADYPVDMEKATTANLKATVRPPRLGGNTTMGVFATRSPYRPNSIGLSSVRLLEVHTDTDHGPELIVGGADLRNHTPIYDIKPYLRYVDCHEDANDGFAGTGIFHILKVVYEPGIREELSTLLGTEKLAALEEVLSLDPRPSYQDDPDRSYGILFAGRNVHFRVSGDSLTVTDFEEKKDGR